MMTTQSTAGTEPIAEKAEATFSRILVPIDFSAASRSALAAALVLHRGVGAEVHAFHLAEAGENDNFIAGIGGDALRPEQLVADAESRLHRFVENVFPGQGSDVAVHARMGTDVLHGIQRAARDLKATMILIGTHPKQTVFRTAVEKLVRELDAAVMLLWVPDETASS